MKKSVIILIVIAVAVIGIIGWIISVNNSIVTLDEKVNEAWAKVEVQYQRRLDLIPNLVETVKGYAAHESATLDNVTRARAGLTDAYNSANELKAQASPQSDAATFDRYNAAQSDLNRAFSIYVNAVREAYPDLKANDQFRDLQTQIEGTENRVATERGRYTEVVREYNTKIRRFPANIAAGFFGYSPKPQFAADAAASQAPEVSF